VAGGEQGEVRDSRRRIAAWAATALSPIVAYLIVKSAAAGISTAAGIALGALPPVDPGPSLKILGRASQIPTQRVSERTLDDARRGLAALPLAFEPFYVAARAAEQSGQRARAIALMEEARHRRPSYPAVRMQLVVYYTQARRYPEALSEIDVILRRNDELRPMLLPELAKLIADPRGRAALATMLAKEPLWREEFFSAAGKGKVSPADARDLYRRIRALKPGGDLSLERQLVLQSQASSGDYAGARATWLGSLPQADRASNARLFDGNFSGMRAPKPFGWAFQDVDVGRAEAAKDGRRTYLDVAYFGGRAVQLAEQVLALPPGRYALRLVARSPNGITSGRLYWRIACQPGAAQIGELDMSQANASERRFATAFAVPASGCPGQSLSLLAEPGDVASAVSLEISRMEIGQ
jgi:tetratricopeptide (TPR) repeat protein